MYVKMFKTINGDEFSFDKDCIYEALDGDEVYAKELKGKMLIRQPNSPDGKDWWSVVDKSEAGKLFVVMSG